MFVLHAIYSYYTISENRIHILAWICSIRSFHSKTPTNTPTQHRQTDTFNGKKANAQTKAYHVQCILHIVHGICYAMYNVYYAVDYIALHILFAKIAPSICSRPSPNAKGAKTDTHRKEKGKKRTKSTCIANRW